MTDTPEPNSNDDSEKPDHDANESKGSGPEKPVVPDAGANLVAGFYESPFASKRRSVLIQYAAEVVFIARMCGSTRLTAEFLSQKFGRKFSRRPVEDLLAKVRKGEIVVTAEELRQAAQQHPTSQRFAELNPEVLDPATVVKTPTKKAGAKKPAAKKAVPWKIAAKKSAKKAVRKKAVTKKTVKSPKKAMKAARPAAKKKPTKRTRRAPRSGPDPGPELPGLNS